ncbi:MAG: DUF6089 family protein [Flavobacteriales bacterium]
MRYIIFLFLFSYSSIKAQKPINELGLFLGGSYYIGDLNQTHFNQTKPAFGLLYRVNSNEGRLALRLHFMYGTVGAYDSKSKDEFIQNRNLHFRSRIFELGPSVEINYMKYKFGDMKTHVGTAYILLGLTYFRMNPQAELNDGWIDLQPLGTEGQETAQNRNSRYKQNQISIPVGLGLKWNLNDRFAMSVEYGIRKTFTDYLDDVSGYYVNPAQLAVDNGLLSAQYSDPSSGDVNNIGRLRGNPSNKDWYTFCGIILSYRLKKATTCHSWR